MSQAHSEQRDIGADGVSHKLRFQLQPWVIVDVAGTHRPAEDHCAGELVDRWQRVRVPRIDHRAGPPGQALLGQDFPEQPRPFHRDVLKHEDIRFIRPFCRVHGPWRMRANCRRLGLASERKPVIAST